MWEYGTFHDATCLPPFSCAHHVESLASLSAPGAKPLTAARPANGKTGPGTRDNAKRISKPLPSVVVNKASSLLR